MLRRSIKTIIIGCTLFLILSFSIAAEKRVLVFHSYNAEHGWTGNLKAGLDEALSILPETVLYHEYLDAKRYQERDYEAIFIDYLTRKYSNTALDLVIVSDDAAMNLIMERREDFFPELPLVFMGINKVTQRLIDMPGATGVFENRNMTRTLAELKRFTGHDEVIIITDSSSPGRANLSKVIEAEKQPGVPSLMNIIFELKSDKIKRTLSRYNPDIPIFLIGQIVDSNDQSLLSWAESSERITEVVQNPLFTLGIATLEHGAVGADDLLARPHSHQAAELAIKILTGTPVDSIDPIIKAETQWGFDWEKLRSLGIDKELLPSGSIFINDEISFYQKNRRLVWFVTAAFVIAILIIGLLMEVIRRENKSRRILEENEHRYTDLALASSMIFWETDATLTIKYTSGQSCLLQENQAVNADRLTLFSLFSENPGMNFPKGDVERLIINRQPLENIIFETFSPSGEFRTFMLNGKPFFDEKAEFTGYRGICKEITEEQNLRTQLEHSQRMDVIGKLAGGIAHEFNNIMGGVISSSELLQSHIKEDREAEEINSLIIETCDRASRLTHQLLAFSRKQEYSFSPCRIDDVIEDSLILLKGTLDRRIEVQRSGYGGSGYFQGDSVLIQNALVNLGINAAHAMPDGGRLNIKTSIVKLDDDYCRSSSFELTPGQYVEMIVEDTGTGIPREILPRVFEPFFTTKERGKGTGLGLSAVYGTVVQHKGEIKVQSELGKGTSFHLRFPLADASDMPEETGIEKDLRGEGTILLAEDDDVLRFGEKKILISLGYSVITAKDGLEAMEKYKEAADSVDLVILDMIMPGKNGRECLRELREMNRQLPVILVSGYNIEELEILKEDGLSAYISKPFRKEELGRTIKGILSK